MKYIVVTSPGGKSMQYIQLSSMPSIFADSDTIHMTLRGALPPEEYQVSFGTYKTNSWSLYRELKKCGKSVSFSIF